MDQDPVAPGPQAVSPAWRLAAPYDSAAQGLIVSGFDHLPSAEALFLRQRSTGSEWLAILERTAPVTNATGRTPRAATLAFTSTGLAALGVSGAVLATFDPAFRQGMHSPERSRRLGDSNAGTVSNGGVRWSGNAQAGPKTPHEVHALLLLYGSDGQAVQAWVDEVCAALVPDVVCEYRLSLDLHRDELGVSREHFGFPDGLSQPIPHGPAIVRPDGREAGKDPWHGIESGDVLLGHPNAYGEPAPGPYVPADVLGRSAGLAEGNAPPGFLDLGVNGTYLVVRQLQQDVAAFWRAMDRCAAAIRQTDPSATHVTAEWFAERVIGRDLQGNLLSPGGSGGGARDPGPGQMPQNAIGFFQRDRFGYGCPMGGHVRRANPRDGLAGAPAFRQAMLDAANSHRLLRRGRKYGTKAPSLREPDGQDRGLLFMCLNTDLARQFEFVQQTWLLNPNFSTLRDHYDPLIGPGGPFTIQESPLRYIVEMEPCVRFAGGEYFFLPSIAAVRYLRILGAGDRARCSATR
jgi:deferrochelatase/peroxidase EfeB